MDEQEIFNQIKELQKQRTSLKKQDAALVYKINELRDKLRGVISRKDVITLILMVYSVKSVMLKVTIYMCMN